MYEDSYKSLYDLLRILTTFYLKSASHLSVYALVSIKRKEPIRARKNPLLGMLKRSYAICNRSQEESLLSA